MSFAFTVEETEPRNAPDGAYIANLFLSVREGQNGQFINAKWTVEEPNDFYGCIKNQTFSISHPDEEKKQKARKAFSYFCVKVFNSNPKDVVTEARFISVNNKKYKINLKTTERGYQNVGDIEPYSDYQFPLETGIKSPENMSYGKTQIPTVSADLNDDVPF